MVKQKQNTDDVNNGKIDLTLSLFPTNPAVNKFQTQPLPPPPTSAAAAASVPVSQSVNGYRLGVVSNRARRTRKQSKNDAIPEPFPWATNQRAKIHDLATLGSKNISAVSGQVQCKKCEAKYEMEFDLASKFTEVKNFIAKNKNEMYDRAPQDWLTPVLPTCKFCNQDNSVKPVIADKKKAINWLFLLLGQMIGCCTLDQLKYFCKHTKNHRTGAKDRVLYLTYLALWKQLDPKGPFDFR